MSDEIPRLTNAKIKEFLETVPLYTWRQFKKPSVNRVDLFIDEIESYCDVCERSRPFHYPLSRGGGAGMATESLKTGTSAFLFQCVSCQKSQRRFLVEQVLDNDADTIKLQKYGQLPREKLNRDPVLQKFLKDDLDGYEKALVCLAHGYGVAAFAYFRRIVETNINRLLSLVEEDVLSSGADQEMLDALAALREDSPMSKKIAIANSALPGYLKPNGLNPLGRLYQVLSEGIHSLSEEECLAKAEETSECLLFLVSELATRREHQTRFKKLVGNL